MAFLRFEGHKHKQHKQIQSFDNLICWNSSCLYRDVQLSLSHMKCSVVSPWRRGRNKPVSWWYSKPQVVELLSLQAADLRVKKERFEMKFRKWALNEDTPSVSTLTSNLLQYPFLLLPSISVRTKEKVSLETDKEDSEQSVYTDVQWTEPWIKGRSGSCTCGILSEEPSWCPLGNKTEWWPLASSPPPPSEISPCHLSDSKQTHTHLCFSYTLKFPKSSARNFSSSGFVRFYTKVSKLQGIWNDKLIIELCHQ